MRAREGVMQSNLFADDLDGLYPIVEDGGSDSAAFDELVVELRASEEWAYVDREIDIRVVRDGI